MRYGMPDAWDAKMTADDLLYVGDFQGALEHTQRALRDYPGDHGLAMALGQALVGLGRAAEALQVFQRCCESQGGAAYPHFYRAACFALLGDRDSMLAALREAYTRDRKVGASALRHVAFTAFREDTDFLATLELPAATALAPEIERVRTLLNMDELAEALAAAEQLTDASDRSSVLDVTSDVLAAIIEELEEHGTAHFEGPSRTLDAWQQLLDGVRAKRASLGDARSAYAAKQLREGR